MEKVSSRDITIIIIGMVLTIILTISLQSGNIKFIKLDVIDLTFPIIIVLIITGIITIFYMKMREINRELDDQKLEQQKINERLKIYKRLSKIEEKVFKNGNQG